MRGNKKRYLEALNLQGECVHVVVSLSTALLQLFSRSKCHFAVYMEINTIKK